jgi:hypothetical protein
MTPKSIEKEHATTKTQSNPVANKPSPHAPMEYDLTTYRRLRAQFLQEVSDALDIGDHPWNRVRSDELQVIEKELGDLFVRHFPYNGLPTTLPRRNSR